MTEKQNTNNLTRTMSEWASALNWIATAPVAFRNSKWFLQSLHLHSEQTVHVILK